MARIAILLDDDFEDSEFETPRTTLLEHEHDVDVIGTEVGRQLHGKKGTVVSVDRSIAEVDPEEYDAVVIPGGYSPDRLRLNEAMVRFTRYLGERGAPVAAICHAGWMLIEAGLANERTLTSWPSLRTDLTNAGARWTDAEVVVDGNLITSRQPDDLPAFTRALLEALGETDELPQGPAVAMGADTLVAVLRAAANDGYTTQFIARAAGDVECRNCERMVNPAAIGIDGLRRLEGASDVAEMMLVAWCTCPVCGTKGTLTLGYGPNAGEADLAVLPHLETRPMASPAPSDEAAQS